MSSLNVIKHHALIPDLVGSLRSQLREKARPHQILWNGADQDLYRPPVGIHYCYQPDCLDGWQGLILADHLHNSTGAVTRLCVVRFLGVLHPLPALLDSLCSEEHVLNVNPF
jgi:hypothetical protein